ncbi:hypothetical protein N2152v2_003439 [Parachlorella kessleri]
MSYSAITARTAASALHGTSIKSSLSGALHVLAVLGLVGPSASIIQSQGSSGLPMVLAIISLFVPLGGGLAYFVIKTYEQVEPWIFKDKCKAEEPREVYGVDVTGSAFFGRPAVLRAVEYAATAHQGQQRKTGEPYVTHCIETALIVEELLSPTEDDIRAEAAIIAALLHDVIDDTSVSLAEVEGAFGEQERPPPVAAAAVVMVGAVRETMLIASMVSKVSQLSQTNQLVRRRLRLENAQPSKEDERKLELLILTMVTEPLVIVIKLADRLHNMRTVYALPPDKQQAVAQETRKVWCTLAERLGIFSLKVTNSLLMPQSELEDLCFAVLQPQEFLALRDAVFEFCQIPTAKAELALDVLGEGAGPTQGLEALAPAHASGRAAADPGVTPGAVTAAAATVAAAGGGRGGGYRLESHHHHQQQQQQQQQDQEHVLSPSGRIRRGWRRRRSSGDSGSAAEHDIQGDALPVVASTGLAGVSSSGRSLSTTTSSSSSSSSGRPAGKSLLRPWPEPDPLDALPHFHPPPDSLIISSAPVAGPAPGASAGLGVGSSGAVAAAAAGKASSSGTVAAAERGAGRTGEGRGKTTGSRGGSRRRSSDDGRTSLLSPQQQQMKELLESVLPFHASTFNMSKWKRAANARRGLEVLQQCAMLLMREVNMEALAPGLEVSVQGRVKSLYSIFKKMARKGVPVSEVYDARALRVVVHDAGGLLQREAIAACYKLLSAVQRLWRRIPGEEDDYMVTPKPSGYQSLHTAVTGPGGVPMEVQIRTSSMHEDAEYGKAAHWAYKERPANPGAPGISKPHEIAMGDPVLQRSAAGRMRQGTVLEVLEDGRRLLVAVSNDPAQTSSGGVTRPPSPEQCSRLLDHVTRKQWWAAGLGDHRVAVEIYTFCIDGRYHKLDHFGVKQTTIVIPTKHSTAAAPTAQPQQAQQAQGEEERRDRSAGALAAVGAGRAQAPEHGGSVQGGDVEYMHNRIRLLRSMLEWRQEDISGAFSAGAGAAGAPEAEAAPAAWERESVIVLVWPQGSFLLLPKGTTAGEVIAQQGDSAALEAARRAEGHVIVNNRPVPPGTPLDDGDYIVLSQEVLKI